MRKSRKIVISFWKICQVIPCHQKNEVWYAILENVLPNPSRPCILKNFNFFTMTWDFIVCFFAHKNIALFVLFKILFSNKMLLQNQKALKRLCMVSSYSKLKAIIKHLNLKSLKLIVSFKKYLWYMILPISIIK